MSPEARAAAVVRAYYATDLDVINGAEGEKLTIEALIAAAIREACNEKLEEAAELALEGHDEAWGNPAEQHGWEKAAGRIRSLKDPTP